MPNTIMVAQKPYRHEKMLGNQAKVFINAFEKWLRVLTSRPIFSTTNIGDYFHTTRSISKNYNSYPRV